MLLITYNHIFKNTLTTHSGVTTNSLSYLTFTFLFISEARKLFAGCRLALLDRDVTVADGGVNDDEMVTAGRRFSSHNEFIADNKNASAPLHRTDAADWHIRNGTGHINEVALLALGWVTSTPSEGNLSRSKEPLNQPYLAILLRG